MEPGWRLVHPGEILQAGDQRLCANGWFVMNGCTGMRLGGCFFAVRRRIGFRAIGD